MLNRTRNFFKELHEDESGPNTVEWILLVIVALLVLVAIFYMAQWAIDKFNDKKGAVEGNSFFKK